MTIFEYLDSRITQLTINYKENSMLIQTAEQNAARIITKIQFTVLTAFMIFKHLVYFSLYKIGIVKQATKQQLGEANKAKIASMMAARAEQIKTTLAEEKAKLSEEKE